MRRGFISCSEIGKVRTGQMIDLFKLILQIGVILLTARIVGMLFKKIHQPQ